MAETVVVTTPEPQPEPKPEHQAEQVAEAVAEAAAAGLETGQQVGLELGALRSQLSGFQDLVLARLSEVTQAVQALQERVSELVDLVDACGELLEGFEFEEATQNEEESNPGHGVVEVHVPEEPPQQVTPTPKRRSGWVRVLLG